MDLKPKELGKSDYERWQRLTADSPTTPEQWRDIAEFAVDAVGVLRVVQLGDIRLWRHAIAQRSDVPLPPLNLPISVWEGYLADPYSSPTFHLADGTTQQVESWNDVFYAWHSQGIALLTDLGFTGHCAENVIGITYAAPAASHVTILERLRRFKESEPFFPMAVRLKSGQAFIVEDARHFAADPALKILAIGLATGTRIIKIEDILSVRSVGDQEAITEQLVKAQRSIPFRPFRIKFCNDTQWAVDRPERLIVNAKRLFFGEGTQGNNGFERVREIGIEYLDSIEFTTGESKQSN